MPRQRRQTDDQQLKTDNTASSHLTASNVSNSGKSVACITRLARHAASAGQAGGAPHPLPRDPLPPSTSDIESGLCDKSSPLFRLAVEFSSVTSLEEGHPNVSWSRLTEGQVISSWSRSTCTDCLRGGGEENGNTSTKPEVCCALSMLLLLLLLLLLDHLSTNRTN